MFVVPIKVPRTTASFGDGKAPGKAKLVERLLEWLQEPQPSGLDVSWTLYAKAYARGDGLFGFHFFLIPMCFDRFSHPSQHRRSYEPMNRRFLVYRGVSTRTL